MRTHFPEIAKRERAVLLDVPRASIGTQMATAVLLGHDLLRGAVLEWRTRMSHPRPPLWRDVDGPSADWDTAPWLALSYEARLVRAMAGALFAPSLLREGELRHDVGASCYERGLADLTPLMGVRDRERYLEPIASAEQLAVDLTLVQIYAHWLNALDQADRVERDQTARAYDVWGQKEACDVCRARWGTRPRDPQWLPPFHPACRCFAQPRYSLVNEAP
ncbi:MAG: structural protein [Vulcanimicrobiaceae bacterium]